MHDRPKILAFSGSLREGSYNKLLLNVAAKGAREAGAEVTVIDLKNYPLPLYNEDLETKDGLPENARILKELLWAHEGFLIASPEYNSSISGVLKNVIDWTTRPSKPDEVYLSCFIDKVIVLMSASPGQLGGLRGLVHVRALLSSIYSLVLPQQKSIPNAAEAFDIEGHLKNSKDQQEVEKLGKRLADFLLTHKKSSANV